MHIKSKMNSARPLFRLHEEIAWPQRGFSSPIGGPDGPREFTTMFTGKRVGSEVWNVDPLLIPTVCRTLHISTYLCELERR